MYMHTHIHTYMYIHAHTFVDIYMYAYTLQSDLAPSHYAASNGPSEALRMLIEAGADLNALNKPVRDPRPRFSRNVFLAQLQGLRQAARKHWHNTLGS